ncbi:MAG: hypothetical protein ACTSU5_22260 [Promethearchaeota archaeon]
MIWILSITPEERLVYQISSSILVFLTILFVMFATVSLVKYLERKSRVALLFALSNLTFVFLTTMTNIGLVDLITAGEKTTIYGLSLIGMSVGIILASMFLYLFYCELSDVPPMKRKMAVLTAAGLIVLILLPFNGWFDFDATGFQLKYVSLTFQTIYCVAIYLTLARGFLHLARRVKGQERKYFLYITLGNVFLSLFFVLMVSRAFVSQPGPLLLVQIGSWTLMALGTSFFFYGYMVPMLTKRAAAEGK